jgi:hypothetical protein
MALSFKAYEVKHESAPLDVTVVEQLRRAKPAIACFRPHRPDECFQYSRISAEIAS